MSRSRVDPPPPIRNPPPTDTSRLPICNHPLTDTSRLEKLPLEIFLLIANELPLESKFILSQTCRRARFNLHRDWRAELERLACDRDAQLRFLSAIARDLPDHLACEYCVRLHKVNSGCVPTRHKSSICKVSEPRICVDTYRDGGLEGEGYHLSHIHVQLALKYSRLGEERTSHLLDGLMEPWSHGEDKQARAYIDGDIRFRAKDIYHVRKTERPRIVNARFLHESVLDIRHEYGWPLRWYHRPLWHDRNCLKHIKMLAWGRERRGTSAGPEYFHRLLYHNELLDHNEWAPPPKPRAF